MLKKAFYLLTAALILTNCAGSHEKSESHADAGVTGTLTLDGKTETLGHVFARRIERDLYMAGADEAIAVFLSNKPLPLTELGLLLKDFSKGEDREFLNETSITGLCFIIKKERSFKDDTISMDDRYIMTKGRLRQCPIMVGELLEGFSLKHGRISARSEHKLLAPDPSENDSKSDLKYSYTVSFETDLQGRSVCPEFEGSPPVDEAVVSEPGTAQGTAIVNGKKIELKYAYARRKKVFFDEPDELIEVVITNRPYQAEEIVTLLDNNPNSRSLQGLILAFSNNPTVTATLFVHKSAEPRYLPSRLEPNDFAITRDRISGKTKGSDEAFKEKWSYSVSLDVPFKR
jgi:hypothetical protein